jgi:chromosome partitioning protein
MYDGRLNFHREVVASVNDAYGQYFRIFGTKIPISIRATETQARGKSIYDFDPNGRIAQSYEHFAREVMAVE